MKTKELIKVLDIIKLGLNKTSSYQYSTYFIFSEGFVSTYNDEFIITKKLQDLELSGAVEAIPFLSFLKKCSEEIKLVQKGHKLIIIDGKSRTSFNFVTDTKLPVNIKLEEQYWEELPTNFKEGLSFTYPICSKKQSDSLINSISIGNTLTASDNHRIVSYKLNTAMEDFLLPLKSARIISKYDLVRYKLKTNWVHFITSNNTLIYCRIINEEFPDAERHLDFEGVEFNVADEIVSSVEKACIFADKFLTLVAEGGKVTISSQNALGRYYDEFTVDQDVTFNIKISAKYFLSILGKSRDMIIHKSKVKFVSKDWEYLLALYE